jgi:hypothetical protein
MSKFIRTLSTIMLAVVLICGFALAPSTVSAAEYKHPSPAFTVTYTDEWEKVDPTPLEVFRARSPNRIPILGINVTDIPEGLKLEGAGKALANGLSKAEIASDVEIFTDNMTKLKDGTAANEVVIDWTFKGETPLTTMTLSVFRDKKWIRVNITHMGDVEEFKDVVYSLTFK